MERKFNDITYDLDNNLIHCQNEEITTLKYYSLRMLSVMIFKRQDVIQNICNWFGIYKCFPNNDEHALHSWFLIGRNVAMDLLTELKFIENDFPDLEIHVRKVSHFIAMQIADFLTKRSICNFGDLELLLKLLRFNNQGTINIRGTILRILNASASLQILDKFKLACNYFIPKEIIVSVFQNLFTTHTQEELTDKSLLIHFWMCVINISSDSMNVISFDGFLKLFQTALESNNEVAVQYLWYNIVMGESERKMILEKMVTQTITFHERTNICMFFLFQVTDVEFEKLFKSSAFSIVQNMIRHVRWHCIFLKIFDALKKYLNECVLELANMLMESYFRYYPERLNFATLVHCYISIFKLAKSDVHNHNEILFINFGKILLHSLYHQKTDLIILSTFYDQMEIDFFHSEYGYHFIIEAIRVCNPEYIENILLSLFKKNYVRDLKKKFFEDNASTVSFNFMKSHRFQEILVFIYTWSVTKELRYLFKGKVLYINQGFYIREFLFKVNRNSIEESFSSTDELLSIYLKDEDDIFRFKMNMLLYADKKDEIEEFQIPCYEEVKSCVLDRNWGFLLMLFDWKKTTIDEGTDLRGRLLSDVSLITVVQTMDGRIKFLKCFIDFIMFHIPCCDGRDIIMFKKNVFNLNSFHKLLNKGYVKTIKDYITWLKPSNSELIKYKWRAELIAGNDHEIVGWLDSFKHSRF